MKKYSLNTLCIIFFFSCFFANAQVRIETSVRQMKTYKESMVILKEKGLIEKEENPEKPESMPKYSDKNPVGLSFYDAILEGEDLSFLDLERTFFNGSDVKKCNFKKSKLKESNLCWNDFTNTNFSYADLSGSDLRAANFKNVRFIKTNLSNADLRQSSFDNCNFTSANMKGAKLTREQQKGMNLSDRQIMEIQWMDTEGKEPKGG